MDKYIGKKLDGRYEILEMIGMGGMANVYKAYDVLEDRYVAIKILRDEFLSDPELLRRFKNESKAIAVLSHPNIVKVYDVSFNEKFQSIVMEYINGITLKEYIEQQGVVKWKEAVHFVTQILLALQHAHEKGIVHRDIKPQNIMLLTDGSIRVMDFGIARFTSSETRTMTDKAIGSVHYISPEQARGERTDEKTDIYSVGVMLYEMLTGKLPFEADTAVSVALKQIQSEPVKPTQLNPNIPDGLEQITLKAMKKNPTDRYQSAAEMLEDIDRFKKNPSIHFEYKYFIDSNPTRHMEKIKVKNTEELNAQESKQKSPAISILSGIAIGFVIVAVLFVVGAIWLINPFQPVAEISMPGLIGQKYQDAIDLYDDIDIVNGGTAYSAEYEAGYICDQDIKEGRQIKKGATVEVTVSKGSKTITLYDLTNYDTITAETHLRSMGLTWIEVPVYSSTVTKGYVVRTMPEEKTEMTEGSSVTLYISQGPEEKKVKVRDFTLINVDDAKRVITKNNLVVDNSNISLVDDSEYPEGVVISQSLEPGTEVDAGASISLTVSSGKSSLTTIFVKVDLDDVDIDKVVDIEAILDGSSVSQDKVNPEESREWSVTLKGTGVSELVVKLDNRIYQEFKVDFDKGNYEITKDNKRKFE